MRQLLLDLMVALPQTLGSFVVGKNAELINQLAAFADPDVLHDRFIYVWGQAGVGKTHLLRALGTLPQARYLPCATPEQADFRFSPDVALYLLDDCERLSPQAQISAFTLFNDVREQGALMVAVGAVAPAVLPVRADLRTRMGWGLAYQLHELSDEEKIAALSQAAQLRGMTLSASVLPYLITHLQRDMRSLSAMLERLDRYSLETQRPITLPLLRELLQVESDHRKPV
ncbi:MAG: DnaA regulatory inactivator Hda [Janthinobacterium lividum]